MHLEETKSTTHKQTQMQHTSLSSLREMNWLLVKSIMRNDEIPLISDSEDENSLSRSVDSIQ